MKAYVYARYSSDNQREESIDAQLRAIREYADRNDILIVREFTDEAFSARSDKRPAFQEMIDLCREKPVDMVLVHKLDRFSRDRYDSAFYRRILRQAGMRLVSVLERLDDTPESIILESVLEGMAEYYSKNLSREVLKGLHETAFQCKHTGGVPPLGYDLNEDKTYRINEAEAEIVRTIFGMFANGKSYSEIITALEGKRTKIGSVFTKTTISSILHNEKYRGVFIYGRTVPQGEKRSNKSRPTDDQIRIEGGMPRIISDDDWMIAQDRLKMSRRLGGLERHKNTYLLSGILFCGKCGYSFTGCTANSGRNHSPYSFYKCSGRYTAHACDCRQLSANLLETAVINAISDALSFTDEEFQELAEKVSKRMSVEPDEIKKYRADLKKTQRELKNLLDLQRELKRTNKMLSDRIAEVEKHDQKDVKRFDEIEKRLDNQDRVNKAILKSLYAITNHMLDGNGVDNLKSARDDLTQFIIER